MFEIMWKATIYALTAVALEDAQDVFAEFGEVIFGRRVLFVGDPEIDDGVYATFTRDREYYVLNVSSNAQQQPEIQLFKDVFTTIKDVFYVRYSFGNYRMLQFGRISFGKRINGSFDKTSMIVNIDLNQINLNLRNLMKKIYVNVLNGVLTNVLRRWELGIAALIVDYAIDYNVLGVYGNRQFFQTFIRRYLIRLYERNKKRKKYNRFERYEIEMFLHSGNYLLAISGREWRLICMAKGDYALL